MPARPTWLLRIPEILDCLEQLDVPVVDRSICEQLFGVRRRRAVELMQCLGGYQAGRTYLVEKGNLIQHLRALLTSPVFASEYQRKKKLSARLDELHRSRAAARVRIPIAAAPEQACERLPAGVSLSPGMLSVTYSTTEELLSRLYAVAQTAAADFESFCTLIESAQPNSC